MADVLTPEQRRKNMQRIKAKDTKIEILLRKALWQKGYRYRKNYKDLPGTPDIALSVECCKKLLYVVGNRQQKELRSDVFAAPA